MANNQIQSFYRVVKAQRGHQFAGLYAVEKVRYRNGEFLDKQIIHEWDLRIISEAKLAQLGGQDAYESFIEENPSAESAFDDSTGEAWARKPEELALTKNKLTRELKLKLPKEEK